MIYNYGDAYKVYPVNPGEEVVFENGSRLAVHDINQPMPDWFKEADCIISDPPWNSANLRSFYTKAEIQTDGKMDFHEFLDSVFEVVRETDPSICWIEIGKEHLADCIGKMKSVFKHVTFVNATYYHSEEHLCYLVRGGKKRMKKPSIKLDGMDEEDLIYWIAQNENCDCIGDMCMGLGLVAMAARKAGKKFVGTELNHKRLSQTIKRVAETGLKYSIDVDEGENEDDSEETEPEFREGQYVMYYNPANGGAEIGKIKSLNPGRKTAFVWYNQGATAACTQLEDLIPIINASTILATTLGIDS